VCIYNTVADGWTRQVFKLKLVMGSLYVRPMNDLWPGLVSCKSYNSIILHVLCLLYSSGVDDIRCAGRMSSVNRPRNDLLCVEWDCPPNLV